MNKAVRIIRRNWIQLPGIVVFLIIWEVMAIILGPFKLPSIFVIIPRFFKYITNIDLLAIQGGGNQGFLPHLFNTMTKTLIGAFSGITIGITIGFIISYNPYAKAILKHIIGALRTIPPLAAIPFFIMWFGPTQEAQMAMLVFYSSVMLIVNTVNAVANVDKVYINYAYTLGASKKRAYANIILPMIMPEIIGGVRVALGISWGIQIVTELMGSPKGMGQVFSMTIPMQALDIIICGILWITLLAIVTDLIVTRTARWFTRWMPSQE